MPLERSLWNGWSSVEGLNVVTLPPRRTCAALAGHSVLTGTQAVGEPRDQFSGNWYSSVGTEVADGQAAEGGAAAAAQ